MKLLIRHPHIEEKHVKHSAGVTIILGTVLEAAHVLYPAGLLLLGIAGCIAVYEPYIIHHVKGNVDADGE